MGTAFRTRSSPRTSRDSVHDWAIPLLCLFVGIPPGALVAQDRRAPTIDASVFGDLHFRMVGPTRGGRVTTVEGHPAHPRTFYMGATGGGVWKTEDHGHTWRNISDGHFQTASIGAIQVADADPDVIYVGTGSDGIRSNVITGRGLYRSTDAGETWELVGLEDAGQIGAVEVHPEDPDLVYVAALGHPFGKNEERGVYRSKDGGGTWERVLFANDSTGAVDLELHPANPEIIYAAMWRAERKPWTIISGGGPGTGDGIWKSSDAGDTWRRVTEGLPQGLIGKIDFAVSRAEPDRVYALVEAVPEEEGLYRSDDAGETWRLVNDDSRRLMHRPFYFTNVHADPTDADVVYVMALRFYKSTDGGESFSTLSTPHADDHDLWINPEDPRIMIEGNDGGANVSLDGGRTWSTQHNQPTAELYQVDVDDRFPYWLYAGQQDNSTIAVPSLPPAESAPAGPEAWWDAVGGCETGPAVPRPGGATLVYANCKGRFGVYDRRTGQERGHWVGGVYMYGTNPAELPYRFQRTVPIEVSPHDPDLVYHGSQYVHRTADGGVTWETISPDLTAFRPERQMVSGGPITRDITGEEHFSTLYVIEASPHDPAVIWTGANDGPVHVTRDGGATWHDVTPPGWPADGRVNAIEISPHDPDRAYVAGYRFLLDDWEPYIFRTADGGRSWTRLTSGENGIPVDHPVRVVREDPEREGLLYAGTEFGLYISFDGGGSWQPFQLDLPVTPVTDIEVHRGDLVLSTMGRSFWILDDLSPVRQATPEILASAAHLFAPRPAHRMRYGGGGFGDRDPAAPEYPPPGAFIDYWLGGEATGPVALEILDEGGRTVRRFEGGAVSSEPGLHRFRWDLRHPGPWSEEGRGGRGPLAVPGRYGVRLTVGDWSATRPLELRIDPRVEAAGIGVDDLREQLELNVGIRDAISEARRTAAAIDSLQGALAEVAAEEATATARALQGRLQALEELLVTSDYGSYPKPRLIDQLEYLYGMTTRADQRPGRDARRRLDELRSELAARRAGLAELRTEAEELLDV